MTIRRFFPVAALVAPLIASLLAPQWASAAATPASDAEFFGRVNAEGITPLDLVHAHSNAPRGSFVKQGPLAVRGSLHAHVVVARPPATSTEPVYLHVRPGDVDRWQARCEAYDACSVPVYFVSEGWYRQTYLPRISAQDGRDQRYLEVARRSREDREGRRLCDDGY